MAFIGLRNLVVCKLKKDDETGVEYAEELKRLPGARIVNMSPQVAEGSLYGDDQLLENESSLTAIEVNVDLASLTLEDEAYLKGHEFKNGTLIENKDDTADPLALGFMAQKSKTGGGGYRMVWLLKGTAKPTDEENQTKEENIEYGTPTLDLVFTPRLFDGNLRFKADTNLDDAPGEEQFFTTEYLKNGDILA